MKMLCVDGNSVLNRAFYAIKLLTTKDGKYTNAIFGFLNVLLKLLDQYSPDGVAVAFDLKAPTFRHKMYDGYKATRKGMPDELASQMTPLKNIIEALGFKTVSCCGYEADDLLGTFARSCRESGDECYIATGDRDSLQLVGDGVCVLLTTTQLGRGETQLVDENGVQDKYGVTPRQLIEVKALMGDSSDNIPGVAGVGEKTALALIQKFKTLDGVYAEIDDESIKSGVRQRLKNGREMAYLSRKLAEIDCAVPIDAKPESYRRSHGDPAQAALLLSSLEMHTLIKKFGLDEAAAATPPEDKKELQIPQIDLIAMDIGSISDSIGICAMQLDGKWLCSMQGRAYSAGDEALRTLLESGADKRVYGSKRLYHAAADAGISARSISFDVLLAAYLLNPSSHVYDIEETAREYAVTPEFICESAPALGVLSPLCDKLASLLDERGMRSLHDDIELPLARVLAEMEQEGFLVDREGIRSFGEELDGIIRAELADVFSLAGREFNLNSPKQLAQVLFDELGLPSGKKTKSGFSTNAEVLEGLREEHEIIDHILNYRTHAKLKSTYVDGLLAAADSEGRVHTDFVQTETRTGRISSLEPNLKKIPERTEID
ncbi:MAG: DNA polymerase [Oscillospiraceae bacterium]